ncbi:hypothetical protein ACX0G7_08980, partial [Flavitalea antarctica]
FSFIPLSSASRFATGRVGGSNPSTPTVERFQFTETFFHLWHCSVHPGFATGRVGGSNPSTPTG